ncbi:hypothetical protein [Luteolibacter soli]
MVSIFFIFGCIAEPLKLKDTGKRWPQLGSFLTFAWMTAPCAWLYGIPVESMTDLVTATKWNIAFLAIVSLWRVALMTRTVAVLTGVRHLRAFVLILAPAAFESMVGSTWKGMSLVQIMGGVRLPPHTQLLRDASEFIATVSGWLFLAMIVLCWIVQGRATLPLSRTHTSSPWGSSVLAAIALSAWIIASAPVQPAVQNRHQLQGLIDDGRYAEAVSFASSKKRSDFTNDHELPAGRRGRHALDLLKATSPSTPSWLRDEWSSSALESLKAYPSFSKEMLADLDRDHPDIAIGLRTYARELRSQNHLDSEEQWWLDRYEDLTDTKPPKAPKPSRQ